MMTIRNARGAYGQTAVSSTTTEIEEYHLPPLVSGSPPAAIPAGTIVALTLTSGALIPVAATAGTDGIVGVAQNTANPGDTVRVVVRGPAQVRATGTSVAVNTSFTATTAGRILGLSAFTANVSAVGFMLEVSGTVQDALKWAYITPLKR
jgi:hypothetical protein